MTNHEIPVGHLVPGTRILVDGDSIIATVVSVEGDTVVTDAGTLYGATTVTEAVEVKRSTRIVVICEDGRCRHLHDVPNGSFTTMVQAHIWADQGHVCTNRHEFRRVEVAGTQGCIVIPGYDGPSLWDCECASCLDIQAASEDSDWVC